MVGALALVACQSTRLVDAPALPEPTTAPEATYYVYVGAESADLMHRIRFGPEGATLDNTTAVGEIAVETEGPHGFSRSPDGEFVYMTTGHGVPDGKLWKYHAGPDTLAGPGVLLGWFPASIDLTPDGLYAFVSNFNLHGEHVPSSVSVVYTPDMIEVEQIETCVMPHGGRMEPSGTYFYSNCMMDDLLIEIDTRSFAVTRRFSVALAATGSDRASGDSPHHDVDGGAMEPTCSPTWVQPSADGTRLYVACNKGNAILEIDRDRWEVRRTFQSGIGPYNLSVTPDGHLLIATLKQGGGVEFFDLGSGRSAARVGSSTTVTHGVAVSPDSRYAFVSVEGVGAEPGKVDVYDLRSFERVAEVAVGQQAGGITFWKMER